MTEIGVTSAHAPSPYMPYIQRGMYGNPDLERLLIFDTTLRDGEQSPGAALGPHEKAHLAKHIYALGVDAMEVSFAISDRQEITATHMVIDSIGQGDKPNGGRDIVVYSLSRAMTNDVNAAWEAVKPARIPGIHTFVSTSDTHRVAKFPGKSWGDIVNMLCDSSVQAADLIYKSFKGGMVEISAEDALRTPIERLIELYSKVSDSIRDYFGGVGFTFNIPDTVGTVTSPEKYCNVIRQLKKYVPHIEKVILSAHIHNDHELAVPSSLLSIRDGVRQIEVAMNGMGERAGNTSLEQIAMNIAHDSEKFYGVRTGIDTSKIYGASLEVASFTGYHPGRNQPVVGSNVRAHEAGIHQDGQIKGKRLGEAHTYEGISAEEIGAEGSRFPLGRRSGINALEYHLKIMGYALKESGGKWDTDESTRVYEKFIGFAQNQRTVTHRELRDLMQELNFSPVTLPLEYLGHCRFQISYPEDLQGALVNLAIDGNPLKRFLGYGNGEVEAVVSAMNNAVGDNLTLMTYTQGNRNTMDARGVRSYARTEMVLKDSAGKYIFGEGYDLDIGVSAAKAFANGLNLHLMVQRYESQKKI